MSDTPWTAADADEAATGPPLTPVLPLCACGEFYQSHHPQCPARRAFEECASKLSSALKRLDIREHMDGDGPDDAIDRLELQLKEQALRLEERQKAYDAAVAELNRRTDQRDETERIRQELLGRLDRFVQLRAYAARWVNKEIADGEMLSACAVLLSEGGEMRAETVDLQAALLDAVRELVAVLDEQTTLEIHAVVDWRRRYDAAIAQAKTFLVESLRHLTPDEQAGMHRALRKSVEFVDNDGLTPQQLERGERSGKSPE